MTLQRKYKRHANNPAGKCKYPHGKDGVECDRYSDCEFCGWNPAVEEERKRQLTGRRKGNV